MRSYRLLLVLTLIAAPACAAGRPARAPLPLGALIGSYDLVSIGGKPLPVREFQAVYHGGHLTLGADGRYVSGIDAETCTPEGACTREAPVVEGEWVLLPDGTLEFDPHGEEEVAGPDRDPLAGDWAPPRIEADGREVRFYTATGDVPYITYRRRAGAE